MSFIDGLGGKYSKNVRARSASRTNRFYAEDLSDLPLELHRTPAGQPAVRAFKELPEPHPARLKQLTRQKAVIVG